MAFLRHVSAVVLIVVSFVFSASITLAATWTNTYL